jgi:tRNA nucleotidyltransferase (CCA-adding enzyme)
MDPDTFKLVNSESLAILQKLSGRRILRELDLNFDEAPYAAVIERLKDLKVLDALKLPLFNSSYKNLIDEIPGAGLGVPYDRVILGWILWLADSDPSVISPLATRLRFTAGLTKTIISASMLKHQLSGMQMSKPSEWTFALEEFPLLSVYAVYLMDRQNELMDFIATWRHVKPLTTGDDLKKRGLEPGPRYSEILRRLRAARLDGEVKTAGEEKSLLDTLI